MIALPLSLPEVRSEGPPGGASPGTSGESPGTGQILAAASAFLPVLMQVLNAPQTQVACPAPNREESATVQSNADITMPSVPASPDPGRPAVAAEHSPGIGRGTLPASAMQDILPREDAMKPEKAPTRVPRVAELQCEEQPAADGAVQAPRPGSTPVRSPIAAPPVEQHPDDGPRAAAQVPVPAHDPVRVLVTRESPSGTPPADIPRLMAEVMAVKGASSGRIFSLESPGKRDAQLAASTTTEPPVNPAPTPTADLQGWEGNDRQSGQLPHREKAIATGGRTGDSSAGENPPTAEIRAAATKDLPATEKEPELSGAVRTGPAAPVVREVPEHRSRSLNTHEAATAAAVQRSQPESETNERTPAEGHVREPLRNIFPILQQNRVGDFVRGKAAERGVGVQGLPRELVRSVLDRVVRELVITGAKGGTEARLALKPDSLGELLVHISMDDNVMTAKIEVTQPAAKAVLDAGMPQLREALTARGISVQQIDVFTSTDSMPRQGREQREGRPRSGGMRRPEAVVAEAVALPRMLGYNTIELSM